MCLMTILAIVLFIFFFRYLKKVLKNRNNFYKEYFNLFPKNNKKSSNSTDISKKTDKIIKRNINFDR